MKRYLQIKVKKTNTALTHIHASWSYWITFRVHIDWTVYGKEAETIVKPGMLDVQMDYQEKGMKVSKHIVDNEKILIGRNDEDGYYFKFGIYRVGDSTVPVCYNLAGYSER